MADLPAPAETLIRVGIIAIAALVGYLLLRKAVELSVRGVLDRRQAEAHGELPPPELERRVRTIARLVDRIGGAIILTIAILMALTEFGIEIGPAVAGLGVVGIAVGFGAQTLIRDWLAGIFIVLENQFNEGDVVRIAGVEGVVNGFSLRRTTLRDLDGTIHVVPNGQITVASNMTRLWTRLTLDVRVAPGSDLDRVTQVVNRVGEELHADPDWTTRLLEPPSTVRVRSATDSSAVVRVLAQARSAEEPGVADEVRKRLATALRREGIDAEVRIARTRQSPSGPARREPDASASSGDGEPGNGAEHSSEESDPTAPVGP
jgi:moderate conductance mechanosensitive channel